MTNRTHEQIRGIASPTEQYATLGRPTGDGQYEFDVRGKPSYTYIVIKNGGASTLHEALNMGVPKMGGMPVQIEKDYRTGKYIIRGADPVRVIPFMGGNPAPIFSGPHTHEIGYGNEDFINAKRLLVFQVRWNDDLSVKIKDGWYIESGTHHYVAQEDSLALTAPSTSGKWYWAKILLDLATETFSVAYGSEFSTAEELTLDDLAAISLSGKVPLCGIALEEGQTGPGLETDMVDCRPWVSTGGVVNLSSPPPIGDVTPNTVAGTDVTANRYKLTTSTTLIIASGVVTATKGYHLIQSESGTSDDLDTISGMPARSFLIIQAAAGHTIAVKNGAGNVFLNGGADFSLTGDKTLLLYNDGTNISDVGAGGSGGGSGTVTSVSATATPTSVFGISVTDPTTTPAIALTMDNQNEKTFLAGPTSGAAAQPAFRAIASDDLAVALASPPNIGGTTRAAGTFGVFEADSVRLAAPNTATLSSDAFSWSQSYTIIAAETGTADNLATINNGAEGRLLTIRADTVDTITVKHNTGNIVLSGGADYPLTGSTSLLLIYNATTSKWVDVTLMGANTALSNLASVAVNTSLISDTDVTDDLGSASIRWLNVYAKNHIGDVVATRVKNTSGGTVIAGDVGYISYLSGAGAEFKTTNTANLNVAWCVVLVDGVNNADIYVATSGVVTINCTSDPAIGNFLATSTTTAKAAVLTSMRPEVFAVAQTVGTSLGGGLYSCTARLYTKTHFKGIANSSEVWSVASQSDTLWTGTINGAPSATSVTVTTSTGNLNCFKPSSTLLAHPRLHNTTRGTYRLVTAVNTATGVITTVSSADSWASTDNLTIQSQTVTSGLAFVMIDIDFSQNTPAVFHPLMRYLYLSSAIADTSTSAAGACVWHPFETFAISKFLGHSSIPVATTFHVKREEIPIISGVAAFGIDATGAATASHTHRLYGYDVAEP